DIANLSIGRQLRLDGPLPQPRVERVSHNRKQPRPAIAAGEALPIFKCTQTSFLYHVLRILIVTREPSRQIVGCIQMRQDGRVESSSRFVLIHSLSLRSRPASY